MENLPRREPIRTHQRKAVAARRVGEGVKCGCGEQRPEALISGSSPIICAECQRKRKRQSVFDNHHIAGRANSPVTVPVSANDHRAELSAAQYDWPMETLENPDGSPLLKGAACIRGATDWIIYILKELLLWIADMLEALDSFLVRTQGRYWWRNTELENFVPERKPHVNK